MKEIENFKKWLELSGFRNTNYYNQVGKMLRKVPLEELNQENLNEYLLERKSTVSQETFNQDIKALKKFFEFKDLDLELPKIKSAPQKLPEHFSLQYLENEIIPMVDMISSNPTRDITLLYFMFYTGLRKSEYLLLKREDFDLEKRTVKVFEPKTQQYRICKYPKKVKKMLETYFSISTEEKNAFNLGRISIAYLCRKLNKYCGDINLTPHTLRHSAAIYWLKHKVPISIVSRLLGHHNITTTMRYLRVTDMEALNIYDANIK